MSQETFFGVLVGVGLGWFLGQIALMFFQREIFRFFDRVVDRVRALMRLP